MSINDIFGRKNLFNQKQLNFEISQGICYEIVLSLEINDDFYVARSLVTKRRQTIAIVDFHGFISGNLNDLHRTLCNKS